MLRRGLPRQWGLARWLCDVAGGAAPAVAVAAPEPPEWARAPLVDLHGRRHDYLRVSLTERCNLRCQYCMPPEGAPLSPRGKLLTRAELTRLVRVLAALGVRKLRLTGGEPTLRPDLALVIEELSGVAGIAGVWLTTNGVVLTRALPALQRAGLAGLNVSLDSLRAARYERLARRPALARVLAGLDLALQLGYAPLKINTVLMKGINDDEILDFVEYTKDRDVEVRFIEFMPFSGNAWDDSRLLPYREALRVITARHPDLRACAPRPNDTARVWQVPGYTGRVGFIASMTQHFCSSCNRLRLTADGNLKVCLFGNAEVSLRDALRGGAGDAELAALVRAALRNKKPQHAGECRHTAIATPTTPAISPSHRVHRGCYPVDISRHAEPGEDGKPADGPHRWLARRRLLAPGPAGGLRAGARGRCSAAEGFSHLDAAGRLRMVDVGGKPVTARAAVAECRLRAGARVLALLGGAGPPKGDALAAARVAGVLAAKAAAALVPLCHPLPLDCARVALALEAGAVRVRCEVRVTARTGAEMEALAGCAGAALTLYDMCKAVDKDMCITDLRVVSKTGGKTDYPPPAPPAPPSPPEPPADTAKPVDWPKETFAPIDFANL